MLRSRRTVGRQSLVDLALVVLLVVLGLVFAGRSEFNRDIVTLVCVYSLMGLGMYIPLILNGELSLAYSAYATIGAYAVGVLSTQTGLPPALGLPLGMAVAAIAAATLGLATSRLNGFYLAGVTLLFDRAFRAFLLDSEWAGGAGGLTNFATGSIMGLELTRQVVTVGSLLFTGAVVIYVGRLRSGPFGLMSRFQREVGHVVESNGVRAVGLKVMCLALGAAIAAGAGSIGAFANRSVYPETFGINILVVAIFAPLLGGQRTPWGAVMGAGLVVWLFFGLDVAQDSGTLWFAIAVILVVRVARDGVLGLVSRSFARFTRSEATS